MESRVTTATLCIGKQRGNNEWKEYNGALFSVLPGHLPGGTDRDTELVQWRLPTAKPGSKWSHHKYKSEALMLILKLMDIYPLFM